MLVSLPSIDSVKYYFGDILFAHMKSLSPYFRTQHLRPRAMLFKLSSMGLRWLLRGVALKEGRSCRSLGHLLVHSKQMYFVLFYNWSVTYYFT